MRMTVLASGSKGNSTVIASARTRVLVDAGLSCKELLRRMAVAGEDPATLDAILVTHEHIDHVAGLSVLARRLNIPVVAISDTNSDPEVVDYPIAGNDDAIRSISIILNALNDAIIEGASKGGTFVAPPTRRQETEQSLTGISA